MVIYKKRYNIKKIIEIFEEMKEENIKTIDLFELLDAVGFDPIDVYFFYINFIRGRFRYGKE